MLKVRFELDAFDWHGHASETLWAEPVTDDAQHVLQIRNSPFFATGINHLDIVRARFDESDAVGSFIEVIERSGHSTYMLLMRPDDTRVPSCWKSLQDIGCSYESTHIKLSIGVRLLYSVDVSPAADIHEVYEMLEQGEDQGVWQFQEGYAHLPKSAPNVI